MEQVTIIGNVGKSEIRESNGVKQLLFTVAVDRSYKNQAGEKIERTNWYSVFSSEVKRAEWIKKGAKVVVQGEFNTSIYKANDGRQIINYTINRPYIEIVGFSKEETDDQQPSTPADTSGDMGTSDDGLPF